WIKVAEQDIDQGKLNEAAQLLEMYRYESANNPDYWRASGRLHLELRNYDVAADAFRECVRLSPRDYGAHNYLGIALGRAGKLEEALKAFETASKINPSNIAAYGNAGTACMLANKPDLAVPFYKRA